MTLRGIPISKERQERLLQEQIAEITEGISEVEASGGEQFTVKQLERTKRGLEARLEKLQADHRKDDVITFEQRGVNRMFVARRTVTAERMVGVSMFSCLKNNIVVLWNVRLLALPVIALLYAAGFVLNLPYGICGSIGMILAGLGGFPCAAGWQLCTGGSFGACGAAAMPVCSTDAAISGGKCLDCRCISVICLAILKIEYDDEPL